MRTQTGRHRPGLSWLSLVEKKHVKNELTSFEEVTAEEIKRRAASHNRGILHVFMDSRKYLPETYVHRREIEQDLKILLQSALKGFLLSGKAGSGSHGLDRIVLRGKGGPSFP